MYFHIIFQPSFVNQIFLQNFNDDDDQKEEQEEVDELVINDKSNYDEKFDLEEDGQVVVSYNTRFSSF